MYLQNPALGGIARCVELTLAQQRHSDLCGELLPYLLVCSSSDNIDSAGSAELNGKHDIVCTIIQGEASDEDSEFRWREMDLVINWKYNIP